MTAIRAAGERINLAISPVATACGRQLENHSAPIAFAGRAASVIYGAVNISRTSKITPLVGAHPVEGLKACNTLSVPAQAPVLSQRMLITTVRNLAVKIVLELIRTSRGNFFCKNGGGGTMRRGYITGATAPTELSRRQPPEHVGDPRGSRVWGMSDHYAASLPGSRMEATIDNTSTPATTPSMTRVGTLK